MPAGASAVVGGQGLFITRIRGALESLSAAERRLAEFVLDFPGDLASYSASELAELASVSKATVSRFVRRLGYESYEDARREARQARESGATLYLSAAAGSADRQTGQANLARSQANLAATFETLSDDTIAEVARALLKADRVLIFGYRASHGLAVYLRWQLGLVLEHVAVFPNAGETVGEHLATLGENACVVMLGFRRRVPQVEAVLRHAVQSGARVLYLADLQSPQYQATWSIFCACGGVGPLDNHVAPIALCDMLASKVIDMAGARGRRRMSLIEEAQDNLGEMTAPRRP